MGAVWILATALMNNQSEVFRMQEHMEHRAPPTPIGTLIACLALAWPVVAIVQGCGDDSGSTSVDAAQDASVNQDGQVGGDAGQDAQSGSDANAPDSSTPPPDNCAALPAPTGTIVHVSPDKASQLAGIVAQAESETTILLDDGTYDMSGGDSGYRLWFQTPNVTLRGASGNRDAVVLDGGYGTNEIVEITASNITIADLTIQKAYDHPIHVTGTSTADIDGTLIYNVHIIDPGEQGIKINATTENHYADHGRIECSLIELTDAGRSHIRNNCYTGGIDAHLAWGWIVRLNTIRGFWCDSGLSEHGIHMWRMCRDSLIERNRIIDCARAIGFGMSETSSGRDRAYPDNPYSDVGYMDHIDGIIRNNFIHSTISGYDSGIDLWQAHGAQVYHNTVMGPQGGFSAIEWRFDHASAIVKNNLTNLSLLERNGATAEQAGNLDSATSADFVDLAGDDLHLAASSSAVDSGVDLAAGLCDDDIDADPRTGPRDVGADERK